MKSRNILFGGSVVLAVVAAALLWGSFSNDNPEGETATLPVPSSSMVTHIDPVTGEPISSPAPGQSPATVQPDGSLSHSTEGLVEEESSAPGGGVIMDLQGRFQNQAIAVADSDSVHAHCVPDSHTAGGGDQ